MRRKTLATLILIFGLSQMALAQFYPTQYRPPDQDWQQLQTAHFDIIYAAGNDSSAFEMGALLEEHYEPVQSLVGGSLRNFPVILNNYNDRSNGFVTPFNFRSEIELPPIKGKAMNPQTGSWFENVGPHELVHALQMSNLGDHNFPRFVSLFSPDLARSFHGAIPYGMLEGIAVEYETEGVASDGGRGNHPYFTNQFEAVFNSNDRWSMGQHMQTSTYSRPFDRHYIGGYEFTAWLHDEFGEQTTRQALDFYTDFPFLGYGIALRHATGFWPAQLYNRFEKQKEDSIENRSFDSEVVQLQIPFDGAEIRRPKWLSDSTLVFYGSFYNARPGFYTYNLDSDRIRRLLVTNTISDYRYDLSADRSELVFSYYEVDPIYDNTSKAELVTYDFANEESKQLSRDGRMYAPEFTADGLLALQSEAGSSNLVSLRNSGSSQATAPVEILSLGNHEIKAVDTDPTSDRLAVVVNKRGLQGLWLTERGELEERLTRPPTVSFSDGAVYDPEWHPDGKSILFSSDYSGTLQLYEYHVEEEEVFQLTDAPYNAFEGTYSPDGNRLAFVRQVNNERLPAVLDRNDFRNKRLDSDIWQPSQAKTEISNRPLVSDSLRGQQKNWTTGSYSPGLSWLKPRTLLPLVEEIGNRDVYEFGLSLHSNSTLSDQAYSADLSYVEDRGWYELSYRNTTFYPGFKTRIFSRPSYLSIPTQNQQQFITLLRQERSLALSVPLQYRFDQNIYSTGLFLEPEFRQSQFRFFDIAAANASSGFANISIANLYGQFNYRLQQNIRDLQPNSGLFVYGELEHYLSAESLQFSTLTGSFNFTFNEPTAVRGGLYTFLSPFRRWNQSLRLGIQGVSQSGFLFDNQSIVSDAFSEAVLPGSPNLLSFDSRYTIPITYADDGGFLLPLYLSSIYLVAYSDTVVDPTLDGWVEGSRSVFGLGIRARFRISNLSFDIGVGYGYEPTRQNHHFFMGDF